MKAQEILNNVDRLIAEGEKFKNWFGRPARFDIRNSCKQLGIFDWWNETLSVSQLKQMKKFLETAIELGYTGYACFKVGAAGCSHGMWANKKESTDGCSPDGACLFHSFRNGDNYWDVCFDDGTWLSETTGGMWKEDGLVHKFEFTLKEVKEAIRQHESLS